MKSRSILITGATGLLGGRVLARVLDAEPDLHAYALVRDRRRWESTARAFRFPPNRVTPLHGDLRMPGVGLAPDDRRMVRREHVAILHLGADNEPSRGLEAARAANVEGTRHLIDLAGDTDARFCLVSSAFVAGCRTGEIPELEGRSLGAGWVNAWEQSKWEAERIVRESRMDFVILRPSAVICDDLTGHVTRHHAFHHALRLIHSGLVPLLPGRAESPIDVVPADYVASAIASLAFRPDAGGTTLHLCAGAGSATLGEIMEWSWDVWSRDPMWRKRSVIAPAFTDLSMWRLFELAVEEASDARLSQITRSMTDLAPRLALETRFDTARADAILGHTAPPVAAYWHNLVANLVGHHWHPSLDSAA